MIIQSIKSSMSYCGNALYRVFISPLTACFHKVLGHPTVTDYSDITPNIDHKMAVTYDEFAKAITTTAWIRCFYDKETIISHAAENLGHALEDLAANLNETVRNQDSAHTLVSARSAYINQAITYAQQEELSKEAKESITNGLKKLKPYFQYLSFFPRHRFKEAAGVEEEPQIKAQTTLPTEEALDLRELITDQISQLRKLPDSASDEILSQIAKLEQKMPALPGQVQSLQNQIAKAIKRLEEIACDIDNQSPDYKTLQKSASIIEQDLDDLLEKMRPFQNEKGRKQLIIDLNKLHSRIYPPSIFNVTFGYFTQQEA